MNLFLDPSFERVYADHPVVLVDVGARGGLRAHWQPMRRHLRLIGFEPDPREFAALSQRPAGDVPTTWLPTALFREATTLPLYIARDRGLTSIFQPNRAFLDAFPDASRFDTDDVQEMAVEPLDAVLQRHQIADVDFLKVDTQGSELAILQGADAALRRSVSGVEVEVEFAPLYRGQPLFADVDAHLRAHGFFLFDLRPCYWKRAAGRDVGGPRGQIAWADALYLKDVEALHRMLREMPAPAAQAKLLKAISIALLYGYGDYALELARTSAGVLDDGQRQTIDRAIRRDARVEAGAWPGQRTLAAAFKRLWRLTAPRDDAWSIGAPRLGNDDD
jgi:FkbM family methyltransferase